MNISFKIKRLGKACPFQFELLFISNDTFSHSKHLQAVAISTFGFYKARLHFNQS